MKARELRDVIDVLILPSLDRALAELTGQGGSRRRARLLVKQSVDQLRGMMEEQEDPLKPPAVQPGLGQLIQRDAAKGTDPLSALTTEVQPATSSRRCGCGRSFQTSPDAPDDAKCSACEVNHPSGEEA